MKKGRSAHGHFCGLYPKGEGFLCFLGLGCVFLAYFFCYGISSLWAQDEISRKVLNPQEATHGSLFYTTGQLHSYQMAPLLSTDVTMKVTGLIVRATVRQEFVNPGKEWVEGVYVFPLPDDAAIDHLRMNIGGRLVEGHIQERGQAKTIYAKAKQEGTQASIVEQERPNLFTASVANIGPEERVSLEIEYQQTVSYDHGQFLLRFPMAIGPRYIPGQALSGESVQEPGLGWASNTDQVTDASRVTPPVFPPNHPRMNPIHLSINLDPGVPLSKVHSTYHPIHVRQQPHGVYVIQLQEGQVPADRDFELTWTPSREQMPQVAMFTEKKDGETYLMLLMLPPMAHEDSILRQKREIVFVIDTSGSMFGTSLEQAQAALRHALNRLSSDDTFNIVQFNDRTHSLFTHAELANPHNRSRAIQYINNLQANGGTEMLPALRVALEGRVVSERLRQVIFMTDGQIGNEEALFHTIQKRLGESRLFTVGIGAAPNSHFMHKAASFGRGTFTFIGNIQEVGEKIQILLNKLEYPVLKDITFDLNGWEAAEVFPRYIPDLYLGEPIVLAAKIQTVPPQASIRGRWGQETWEQVIVLEDSENREGIATFWAGRKISSLMDQKTEASSTFDLRTAVINVATQHHLVSRFTSLVAVDRTPVRPHDRPVHSKAVPGNLPKGQQHIALFGLPQTGTSAQFHLFLGIMLVLGSTVCWHFRRQES